MPESSSAGRRQGSPSPRRLFESGKTPLLYSALVPAEPGDSAPIMRLAESRHYRARGFQVAGPLKPLSKCFASSATSAKSTSEPGTAPRRTTESRGDSDG